MKTLDLPMAVPGGAAANPMVDPPPRLLSLLWLERIHMLATWLLCQTTILLQLEWMGSIGVGLAGGLGLLAMIGLIIGHKLQLPLGDLYRQFQYREKFGLFLFHVGFVLVARFVLGIREWEIVLSLLLILFCLQAINFLFYARIYFLCMMLVVGQMILADPPPHPVGYAAWFVFLLLAFRMGHVRYRIEALGRPDGTEKHTLAVRTILPLAVPVTVGVIVYTISSLLLTRRGIEFQPGYIERDGTDVFLSYSQIIWESFFLCLIVIALMVALNWIERKLRGKRKGRQPEPEPIPTTVGLMEPAAAGRSVLEEEHPTGPRERILAAFRRFCRGAEPLGFARRDTETWDDYLERALQFCPPLQPHLNNVLLPFNKACYHIEEPSEGEASAFETAMERSLEEARQALRTDDDSSESSERRNSST